MNLGKLSSADLLKLLTLIPTYEEVIKAGQIAIREKRDKIFTPKSLSSSWHHLYEIPHDEQLARLIHAIGRADEVKKMAASDNPPQAAIVALQEAFQL